MKQKKSLWSRVIRTVALALIFVFAGVVFLLFLLTLSPGEAWLKGMAEARLQDALGQEVKIGWLETNLLSRLRVREVQIYEGQAEKRIPFLTLGYAKVKYSLADLIHGRLLIKSMELDSLKLFIQRDSLGILNLPKSKPSAGTDSIAAGPPLHIRLGNLSLRNSSLEYLDRVLPLNSYLKNLSVIVNSGKEETYHYHVQVDTVEVEYQGVPLRGQNMRIAGHLSNRQMRLDSVSVNLPGLQFTGNAEAVVSEDTSITGDFRLQGNPDQLLQAVEELFPRPLPQVGGNLNLSLHLQGSLSQPQVSAKLELKTFDVASMRIQHGLAEVSWEANLIDLQKLRLELLGGTISGKGSVSTDSLFAHQLSMSVDGIDLAKVWQSLYGESGLYQGRIDAKLKASGEGQDPTEWKVQADLNLNEAKYNLKPVPDLSATMAIDKGLARLSFHQEDSEAEAQVKLEDEQIDGEFSVKIIELETLAGLVDVAELSGGLEIHGVLSGKLDSLAMQAEIEARNIKYQNFPLDSLKGTIVYRDGQARIEGLRFAGDVSPIDSLEPPFHMAGIRGGIVYHGQVSGKADSLTGDVTVELTQLRYAHMGLDQGFIGIVLENQRINLSSLLLRRDSLLIRGSGKFDIQSRKGTSQINLVKIPLSGYNLKDNISDLVQELDDSQMPMPLAGKLTAEFDLSDTNRLSLQMVADRMDLEGITTLFPQPQELGGLLGFHLDFSGNLDDPQAQLDFHLRKPRFRSIEMDSLQGHLSFTNQRFRFELVELHDRGNYSQIRGMVKLGKRADGTYFVSDSSLIEGQAKGENLDLSLLAAFMPQGGQISGRGSFDLSWNGTLDNPRPAGIFSIENGLVQPDSARPGIKQISLNVSLQDSITHIQNLSGVIQETPFNLKAQIIASQWKHFDVQMNLAISDFGAVTGKGIVSPDSLEFDLGIKQMDLSLLLPFTTDLYKLSGSLDMGIRLSGSPQDPGLDGRLEIRDLLVQPVFLNIPLDQGVIKLRFDKNRVMVDSLFVRMDAGFLFASGVLSHEQGELSDVNLQATMSNLKIDRPKELIALIESARFDYRRQNNYYLLDGDMTLGECRTLVNFRPQSILSFVRAVEKPWKELPPLLQQTRLDVRVRESEKIWIDNNLARLRLHTELGIIGSPAQPNVTGRVSVEEGYVLYLDRKFKVKNGVVDFVDPDRLNPIIDFAAEATVKTYRATEMTPYTVTIAITGPLDEVVVELKSEPALDKSNILSLLTLGVTRDELVGKDTEGKEGSLSSALLERAQSLSSQKISGYTTGRLGDLLGLDQMSIEGNLFRFDKSWGPQLLASKRISRRMTMTYITTVGHFNERNIRLDYELSRHFSLEGETDQRGRSGMNLKYKLRSK